MATEITEPRLLLIGGVGTVKGRVPGSGPAMLAVCDALEGVLKDVAFTAKAPFRTVSLIIRFGTKDDLTPEHGAIDRRHGELPVAVEFDLKQLRRASQAELELLFKAVTLDILLDVASRYALPDERLRLMREEIGPGARELSRSRSG